MKPDLGIPGLAAVFALSGCAGVLDQGAAHGLGVAPADRRDDDDLFSGVIESTPIVARVRFDEVTTGRIRWRNEVFWIAELEIFTTLKQDDSPCAILGAGLFIQRDFIIDFARSRLLVKVAMDEMDVPGWEDGKT